jgi:hypothetical protein
MRDLVLWAAFVTSLGTMSGCDRAKPEAQPAGGADGSSPAKGSGEPVQAGPKLPLTDGFEGDAIAAFWRAGNYGAGLYEPGAVVVTTDRARSGARSARITVKEGDVERLGDDGQKVERAELDSGHYPFLDRDIWYGYSFLLPQDFPIVNNRLVIAQCKQSDVEGSPLIGQRFRAGYHYLTIRPPGASGNDDIRPLPEIRLGRWVDMVYHLRYSYGDDGRIEVWMDGVRVVDYTGPTASKSAADRFYHKVGLYRDRWKQPMTMYVDNYTLGESFEAVDPARFDQRR